MKNNLFSLAAVCLVGLGLQAFAADTKLAADDEAFVKKAAEGGMMEVKMGEMANTKAKRADVKAFGAKMVADHSMANAELKTLATQKGVILPEDVSMKHGAMNKMMDMKEGDDFDGAYVKDMIADHEKDVQDFEKAANSAQDPDVKAFAAKTLPVLKTHLEMIKKLGGKQ